MKNKFDYNSDDVMKILNNPEYSDEQKKELFENYKDDLKLKRKNEIISKLNECAKQNPIITEEDYVNVLKRYSDDDLSKPFETIESEISTFEENMKRKYQEYLMTESLEQEKEEIIEDQPLFEPEPELAEINNQELEDTKIIPTVNIGINGEFKEEISQKEENNVDELNEKPIFEEENTKEVLPDELEENNERGNASAMIISIIAIIIGAVVMYSIIKLK